MKTRRFVAFFTATFFLCLIASTCASPPASSEINRIRVGIRDSVPPIKNFCTVFVQELKSKLSENGENIKVTSQPSQNAYKGPIFLRFQGLKDNNIDVECGQNSISSEDLIDPLTDKPFSEAIEFSDRFYKTSIKLLLREDRAQELAEQFAAGTLETALSTLKIGVLEYTTTADELRDLESIYANVIVFETPSDGGDPPKGKNSLEQALDALETGEVDAIASDAIILESYLKDGVSEANGDKPGTILYQKERPPYDEGFSIFPEGNNTLPRLDEGERYGIAVRKVEDSNSILVAVNATLDALDEPDSLLDRARDCIDTYQTEPREEYQDKCDLDVLLDNPNEIENQNSQNDQDNSDTREFPWDTFAAITATAAFVLVTALGFFAFRSRFSGQINSPFGSLSVQGENRESTPAGIEVTNAKSREGGLQARDEAGGNIKAKNLNTRDDIQIQRSTNRSPSVEELSKTQDHLGTSSLGAEQLGIDVHRLNAGGNITIAQISQDLGISRFKHDRYHEIYVSLWELLLALRLTGEEFSESINKNALAQFSIQLREARSIIPKRREHFKNQDYVELISVLRAFGEIQVGTQNLREIRGLADLEKAVSVRTSLGSRYLSDDAIARFEDCLFEYEHIVEKLRLFFRQKLSV